MVSAQANNDQPGAEGEDVEFVDNTLDLDGIPQLELPFEDAVTNDMKNLFRALIINQQNIINNTSFLYKRIKELGMVLQRIMADIPNDPPGNSDERMPSMYSIPEE